jgi:hypothetical protein
MQVTQTVEAWAEHFGHEDHRFEVVPRTLFADGYPEGTPGAEVSVDARVHISEISDLMTRLEDLSGLRPYCWQQT